MNARQRAVGYLPRFFQILRVLIRQLWRAWRRKMKGVPVDGHLLLREGFEQVGGCFVKFGQILSLQIDTLPREYCDSLLALLDSVPTVSPEEVEKVFLSSLNESPQKLFRRFDYRAIASASIGQVHRAELPDGTAVAVKVQRPGVRQAFQRDVLLMDMFVRLIFLFRIRTLYFMRDPVRELATWTRDELDYRREASHCKILADNAKDSLTERLPKIYWELTTAHVLTMEFLDGPSVSTYLRMVESGDHAGIERLRANGFSADVFAGNVISNFLSDAFRHGVFHADLHPANLLILPNNVVGYVDFGIVATLTTEARRKQIELTLAYSSGSPDAIYREFLNICIVSDDADLEGMRHRVAQLARAWYEEPAIGGRVRFRVTVTQAMMDLLAVCRDYGVLVDREMIKYIRSTILVDGLVSRLAPGFDLAASLRSAVEEYMVEEARRRVLSPEGMLSLLSDLVVWLKSGPGGMLHALDQFERRKVMLRTSISFDPDKEDALRLRALAGGAVWAFSIFGLSFGGGLELWKSSPFFMTVTIVFVTSWTLWLLILLRRLTTK